MTPMDMTAASGLRLPKPERRQKAKDRQVRVKAKQTKDVRSYVFGRERNVCRCCRLRLAESLHEMKSRGAGGKRSRKNSIAVCGQLVGVDSSCHTYLQQSQIKIVIDIALGAEGDLTFIPLTAHAADYMRVAIGKAVESPTMFTIEAAE